MSATGTRHTPSRQDAGALTPGLVTVMLAIAALFLPAADGMPKGELVGWLLLLTGACELGFGLTENPGAVRRGAVGSGLITALAGLLFVANPLAQYFSVANIVMAWLVLRGLWVFLCGARVHGASPGLWLMVRGAVDILLGAALLIGLQVTFLVVAVFGPTPEVVAQFALILAISFLSAGGSQIAGVLSERQSSKGNA